MKLIKIFSEHTDEKKRLYSVPRFQKEFNSKAQKELRRRLDLERGLEYSKLDPAKEYPKDIVDEGIRRGRSLNSQPVQTKNLKERAKELKKSKRIKFLKKGAKATAIGVGAVGVGVGIKKAVDNHKEKKLLKEYREQLKTYSIFSKLFPKKNEVPNYLGLPVKISGKINQENLGKEIWENEMKEWEYSPLNSKYKKTDFQKFLKNLEIEKVPKKDWLGDDEELTVCLKDDFYLGWWNIYLDKNGKISNISFND